LTGVNRSADEAIARNPAQSFRPQNLKIVLEMMAPQCSEGRVPNARSSTPQAEMTPSAPNSVPRLIGASLDVYYARALLELPAPGSRSSTGNSMPSSSSAVDSAGC
jgi:hypothetical protein